MTVVQTFSIRAMQLQKEGANGSAWRYFANPAAQLVTTAIGSACCSPTSGSCTKNRFPSSVVNPTTG